MYNLQQLWIFPCSNVTLQYTDYQSWNWNWSKTIYSVYSWCRLLRTFTQLLPFALLALALPIKMATLTFSHDRETTLLSGTSSTQSWLIVIWLYGCSILLLLSLHNSLLWQNSNWRPTTYPVSCSRDGRTFSLSTPMPLMRRCVKVSQSLSPSPSLSLSLSLIHTLFSLLLLLTVLMLVLNPFSTQWLNNFGATMINYGHLVII